MGKNRDLVQVLSLVIIGMFIPFFGSIALSYGLDDITRIAYTFGYFLVFFGLELGIVFLYFTISGKIAKKQMKKFKK
jgi:hypothetical protein